MKLGKLSRFNSHPQISKWVQLVEKAHLDSLGEPVVEGLNLCGQRFDFEKRLRRERMGLDVDGDSEDDEVGKKKAKSKKSKGSEKENQEVTKAEGEPLRRAWPAPRPVPAHSSSEKSVSASPPKSKSTILGKVGGWSNSESEGEEETITTKLPLPTSTKPIQPVVKINRCENWGSSDIEEVVVTVSKRETTLGISKTTSTPPRKLESKTLPFKKVDWCNMSSSPDKIAVDRKAPSVTTQPQEEVLEDRACSLEESEEEAEEEPRRKRVFSQDFGSGCESQGDSGFIESRDTFEYDSEASQEEEKVDIKIDEEERTGVEHQVSRMKERVRVSSAKVESVSPFSSETAPFSSESRLHLLTLNPHSPHDQKGSSYKPTNPDQSVRSLRLLHTFDSDPVTDLSC